MSVDGAIGALKSQLSYLKGERIRYKRARMLLRELKGNPMLGSAQLDNIQREIAIIEAEITMLISNAPRARSFW